MELSVSKGGYVNDPQDSGGETNFGITVEVARANGYTGGDSNVAALSTSTRRVHFKDGVIGGSDGAGVSFASDNKYAQVTTNWTTTDIDIDIDGTLADATDNIILNTFEVEYIGAEYNTIT